jgi:anti-sigma factor RsiW
LADAGGYDQALAMLERLAAERPDDGALQEALAELLTSGAPEQRKLALRKWREVQQKSRPGTPRWFRASFGLAQTQYLLGNKVAAAAAVRLVARTYPELGGAALKTKYEQLLADCQR